MTLSTDAPPLDTSKLRYDYNVIDTQHRQRVMEAAVDILAYGRRAKESIIAMGQRLIEVKALLPDGTFTGWLTAEFELSSRMAENLMNVARQYGERPEIISVLNDTVLYLLAAPSTPDTARAEVEQVAAAGQKVTVEFAKETIHKHKPEPVQREAIWNLEQRVRGWIDNHPTDDRDDLLDLMAENKFDNRIMSQLLAWLNINDVRYRKPDLFHAINNLREQRRQAKRQAEARVVYTEPMAEPAATMPDDLLAAGYELKHAGMAPNESWAAGRADNMYLGLWRRSADEAIADARNHFVEHYAPIPAEPVDPIVQSLLTEDVRSIIFADTLRIATLAQLEAALVQLANDPDLPRNRRVADRLNLLKAQGNPYAARVTKIQEIDGVTVHHMEFASVLPLADTHATPVPEPPPIESVVVSALLYASDRSARFQQALIDATLTDLEYAIERVDYEVDPLRRRKIEYRRELLIAAQGANVLVDEGLAILDKIVDVMTTAPADDARDADELAAIAIVEAEVVQEDAKRAERDEARASYERVPDVAPTMPDTLAEKGYRLIDIGNGLWRWEQAHFRSEPFHTASETVKNAYRDYERGEEAAPLPAPTPEPPPPSIRPDDMRAEEAAEGIELLTLAREWVRQYYGDLTGRYTDTLEFERGVKTMLGQLDSLVNILLPSSGDEDGD